MGRERENAREYSQPKKSAVSKFVVETAIKKRATSKIVWNIITIWSATKSNQQPKKEEKNNDTDGNGEQTNLTK